MKIVPDLQNQGLKVEREKDSNAPGNDKETWWDRQQARNRAWRERTFRVGWPVLLLALLGWRQVEEITKHKTIQAGPAAPWAMQMNLAQEAANRIDKDAVLEYIQAEQIDANPRTFSTTLNVRFEFRVRSELPVLVYMEDSQPPAIVRTSRGEQYRGAILPEKLKLYNETIKTSPRDALKATLPEVRAVPGYDEKMPDQLIIGLVYLEDNPRPLNRPGKMPGNNPVLWRVNHFLPYAGLNEISFWVDPNSGQVLGKDVSYSGVPTRTPNSVTP